MRTAALLVFVLAFAGCADAERDPVSDASEATTPAPLVTLQTAAGPVTLSHLLGSTVVLQFAERGDVDEWAALAEVTADLEASGAVVLAVETDGATGAPAAFGYDGQPLAIVVDGEGTVRGHTTPRTSDAIYALAAPVLAEADLSRTVAWPGADTLTDLVQAGGMVIDLEAPAKSGAPPVPAMRIAPDSLTIDALPADFGTPIALRGEAASEVAERIVAWGYAAVFVTSPDGRLDEVMAARPPSPAGRPGAVRG